MSFNISIDDADAMRLLAVKLEGPIEAGAFGIAAAVQDVLAPYPRHTPRPQPFVSPRQRRGFFAKLRSGEIQVPYRRGSSPSSETLNRKWDIRRVQLGARLRNLARYSGLVHGRKRQTKYHARTGWVREDIAVQKVMQSGEAKRIMADAIGAALKEAK